MSTEITVQRPVDSVDTEGISIISATQTFDEMRRGTMYNVINLAAAVLVHFHALQRGSFLAVMALRWTAATVGTTGPQAYTAHTATTVPSYVVVTPPTGISAAPTPIPTYRTGDWVLTGACSRVDSLFTCGTLDGVGFIQHLRVTPRDLLLALAEETLASVGDVTFGAGCYRDGYREDVDNLVVFGTDSDGLVYQARKHLGGIGAAADQWYYRGEKGWLPDPDYLSPLLDVRGNPLVSVGPLSSAVFRDKRFLSTVRSDDDGNRTGWIHVGRASTPYAATSARIALGDDDTYLGHGVQLQTALNANTAVLDDNVSGAIPYCRSVQVIDGSDHSIDTAWGLWTAATRV